jgi:ribosomal protein RSM22 (predicted rRNA methylase)
MSAATEEDAVAALPESLIEALEEAVAEIPARDLHRSVSFLIDRYRSEREAPVPILASAADVAAYAAYRMPATYAAARAALTQFAALAPDFQPRTQVDVGGGTGAAIWAAAGVWPSLESVEVLERVPKVVELGQLLARAAPAAAVRTASWRTCAVGPGPVFPDADLITMSYLLGELAAADRDAVISELAARAPAVAVIEPGTPAGYQRVIAARQVLIEAGLTIVAPCPHDLQCPISAGRDWCHFAARINRTALHRQLKAGALSYEDEKFSYLIAARTRWPHAGNRILRHPQLRKGAVSMTLCATEPGLRTETVFKRDRDLYRQARNAGWGDAWPPGSPAPGR